MFKIMIRLYNSQNFCLPESQPVRCSLFQVILSHDTEIVLKQIGVVFLFNFIKKKQ